MKDISEGWPIIQFLVLDPNANILASKVSTTTSNIFYCDSNCYACKTPEEGKCDSQYEIQSSVTTSADQCETTCNVDLACKWFSFCPLGGLCTERGTENVCTHYSDCFTLDSQSSAIITGFYSRPSTNADRTAGLDHKTCIECKNEHYLNENGKCVAACPTGTVGLGMGPQGKFCSRTWIPFAITTSEKCAEDLPYGSDVISTAKKTGYFSTANRDYEHLYFLQRFYVDDVLQFQSLWKFNSIATLEERMSRASINGEALRWRVIDDYDRHAVRLMWIGKEVVILPFGPMT